MKHVCVLTMGILAMLSSCKTGSSSSVESTPVTGSQIFHVCQTKTISGGLPYQIKIDKPDPSIKILNYGPNEYNIDLRDNRQVYYNEKVQAKPSPTSKILIEYTGPSNLKLQINKPAAGETLLTGTITVMNAEALSMINEPIVCQ